MHSLSSYRAALCAALAVAMNTCGGSRQAQPNEAHSAPVRAAAPEDVGVTNLQEPESTPIASSASSSSGPSTGLSTLDDDHLAGVLEAIHDGEIRIAQMAEGLGTAPEVRRFAHEMVTASVARLNQDKTLWSTNDVTPVASHVSGTIDSETQAEATTLADMEGEAFDAEYIDLEVRSKDRALQVLDGIIDASKTELKTDLVDARQEIGERVRAARAIQAQRRGGPDF
jgi:predicted outer membrane protein